MFQVKNLSLYFQNNKNKTYLLNDICFDLDKGDCLGIIGKSGDGKSTLAKALIKIYDKNIYPENGSILINNDELTPKHRGASISLLFQNPNSYLNPLMKVGKQISEMLIFHNKENKKVAKSKAIELMKEVGIEDSETIYNYLPHEISGGMQQRICLCIALICKPEVIILDEFLSYLDKDSKKSIIRLIKELHKKYNFSLILISHDFKEVYSLCNKIAIMRKGQMIEFATTNEIIENPIHPYTIELLYDYLRYYKNIDPFHCPLLEIETQEPMKITYISPTHYVRSWYLDKQSSKIVPPSNFDEIKELLYENIRD